MTDGTGGTPAGWYDDGRGQLRYFDGTAWTEHTAPIPGAPAAPAAPQQPQAPVQPQAQYPPQQAAQPSGPSPTTIVPGATTYGETVDERPVWRKPWVLIAAAIALLLLIGGLAVALSGGDDDPSSSANPTAAPTSGGSPSSPAAAGGAQTVSKSVELTCQPSTFPAAKYTFGLKLDVTPSASGGPAEISVSADNTIGNTGPSEIEAGAFQFETAVTVNGAPLQLIGPTTTTPAKGDDDPATAPPLYTAAELPLVAKATAPATATGPLNVEVVDLYFNNITGSTGTPALGNVFDARCNPSPQPNTAPTSIGLKVPAS